MLRQLRAKALLLCGYEFSSTLHILNPCTQDDVM